MLFLLVIFPAISQAAYLIHLKNGGRFLTPRCWEEEGELKFYILEGVAGIEKALVDRIVPVQSSYQRVASPEDTSIKAPDEVKTAVPEKDAATIQKKTGTGQEEVYLEKFRSVSDRAKGIPGMSVEELNALSNDVTALKKEVLRKGIGHFYADELRDLYAVGDQVEEAIKARSQ